MKLKNIILSVLSLALVAVVAIGGTLAYLTDRDSEANVFTVGDVAIELNEDFEQGAELIPGVRIKKEATITNTGKNDAWVWMTVAVPAVLDDENAELGSANVLHWNMPGCFWNGYHNQDKYIQSGIKDGYLPEGSTGVAADDSWINDNVAAKQTINGVDYNVYTFKYVGAIVPGETTNIGLSKVFLDENVDINTDGQWYVVENGVATKIDWNSNTNGNPVVYVSAYAVQADGYNNVEDAYKAYQTQWGENGTEYGTPATVVTTADELKDALANGENVVMADDVTYQGSVCAYGVADTVVNGGTLNGNGQTLSVTPPAEPNSSGYFDYTALSTTGGTIENLTIDNGFRAVFLENMTEDVYLRDMKIGGKGVCYAINTGYNTGDYSLIVTDCEIYGWSSFAQIKSASFTNCVFGQGGYYTDIYGRVLKPYVNTTLTDCSFIEHMNLDLSALTKGHKVTFTDCTVNGRAVTADVFTPYAGDDSIYDTALFSVDLPDWANSINDCIAFN